MRGARVGRRDGVAAMGRMSDQSGGDGWGSIIVVVTGGERTGSTCRDAWARGGVGHVGPVGWGTPFGWARGGSVGAR
jgi:hypothetical protein